MQISLRSHLIAGTAAVVGAGAIAMNPVMGAQLSLPSVAVPSVANVALAGLDSPISELLATVIMGSQYLFSDPANAFDVAGAQFWPYAGFGTTFGVPTANYPLLPTALFGPSGIGGYSAVGLIPQIINDALPIVSQLGYNGSDYLAVAASGLAGAGYVLSEGVWNAAGQALTLNIAGAISTLISSVQSAGSLALASGAYVLGGVVARAEAVVNYLVSAVPTLIGGTVAQVTALVNSAVAVVTNTVAAIGGGDFTGAYNAVVDGLLGPSGVPGTLLNLTIGAGVQTGPIVTPNAAGLAPVFAPSIRTEVQSLVKGVAGALATPNPVSPPVASVKKAARSAASRSAAAVAAPAGESSAAADSSAPAEKSAAHRASRKAARAAS